MLIKNANILTMNGISIPSGWVMFQNGKIVSFGAMDTLLETKEQESYDARGAMLLPGFIDAHTHLGMWEDSLGFEGDDGNEDTDPSNPQMRAVDAINPMDKCFSEALDAGVTTVVSGPGSANPIGGQLAALKTGGVRIDDMLLEDYAAMKFALGENPKNTYHEKNQTPVTRMATAAIIREQLYKAKRYEEDIRRAEGEEDLPDYDMKCEALLPLLRGEKAAHFHAHRCDDIFTTLRICREFSLTPVLVHATGGHEAAELLAAEHVPVLCGPLICDRSKPELRELTPRSAGILQRAGVEVAIITDHPVIPIQYLPLCAGLAVREGMDHEAALRAITINPAKICGIADRVGSIDVGKDADFILFREDPLSLAAKPEAVFLNGERVR